MLHTILKGLKNAWLLLINRHERERKRDRDREKEKERERESADGRSEILFTSMIEGSSFQMVQFRHRRG